MEEINDSNGNARLFGVVRDIDECWLTTYCGNPDFIYGSEFLFVFIAPHNNHCYEIQRGSEFLRLPEKIVIFDLECTTWDGAPERNWSGPGEHREVVQMGAALIETRYFTELSAFKQLIKPSVNPILSEYFIDLTNIKQDDVDEKGIDFKTFLKNFVDFCGENELYCFSRKIYDSQLFDCNVLIENCKLLGIEFPFIIERFHNIQEIFYHHGYISKQSGATPETFGLKITAHPHDALNDVRGIITGLRALKIISLENRFANYKV